MCSTLYFSSTTKTLQIFAMKIPFVKLLPFCHSLYLCVWFALTYFLHALDFFCFFYNCLSAHLVKLSFHRLSDLQLRWIFLELTADHIKGWGGRVQCVCECVRVWPAFPGHVKGRRQVLLPGYFHPRLQRIMGRFLSSSQRDMVDHPLSC